MAYFTVSDTEYVEIVPAGQDGYVIFNRGSTAELLIVFSASKPTDPSYRGLPISKTGTQEFYRKGETKGVWGISTEGPTVIERELD